MRNPPIIELLNKVDFDADDLRMLLDMLLQDPSAAQKQGSHQRSTIWVCCQHSDCIWRSNVALLMLLRFGANVNQKADNGFTPLESLYRAWTEAKEHKRAMAKLLVLQGANVPAEKEEAIREWLATAPYE